MLTRLKFDIDIEQAAYIERVTYAPDRSTVAASFHTRDDHWMLETWSAESGESIFSKFYDLPGDDTLVFTYAHDGLSIVVALPSHVEIINAESGAHILNVQVPSLAPELVGIRLVPHRSVPPQLQN